LSTEFICYLLLTLLYVPLQARAKQRQFEIDSLHDSMFGWWMFVNFSLSRKRWFSPYN